MKSGRGGQADTHHAPVQGREKGTPIRRPGLVTVFAARPEPPAARFPARGNGYNRWMVARWLIGVIALLAVVAVIFLLVSAVLDGGGY